MAEGGGGGGGGKDRKIMVAVDESEESMYALTWCLNNIVSNNPKDTIILLYAKPPRVIYTTLDGTGYLFSPDMVATMERYSNEVAGAIMDKAKNVICTQLGDHHEVKVETRVENGDAREVICQMVEKLSVDLLVVGSHGYGAIKRVFLGSVSNHCAQSVKCPVLIAKMPKSNNGSK